MVPQQFDGQLDEESLFLFCGRRADRIKALYRTSDGYILLYKRLSNGRFQWPRSEAERKLLDPQSFRWLMEGVHIEQKTTHAAAEVSQLTGRTSNPRQAPHQLIDIPITFDVQVQNNVCIRLLLFIK